MSVDHLASAAKRGPSALDHVGVSVPVLYPHVAKKMSHGSTNFPAGSQVVLHQHETHTTFPASTSIENILSSGGFVDIRIPAGAARAMTGITIHLQIENHDGIQVFLPAYTQFLFDRVEALADGGNNLIARWEPEQLLHPFRHVSQQALAHSWNPGFHNEGVLPVGGVVDRFIPLLSHPFVTSHVHGGALRSDSYIRLWFKGASAIFFGPIGEHTPPTLKLAEIIVSANNMAPQDNMRLLKDYSMAPRDYRFGRPGLQSFTGSLHPSQRYEWQLSAVQGLVTEMIVNIRPSFASGSNAYAYKTFFSYELIDGSGANVLGGGPTTMTFQKSVIEARKQYTGVIDSLGEAHSTAVIEFGDARADMNHGTLSGYLAMDGTFRLALTMDSDLVTGNYEVRVYYLSAAKMTIAGGNVRVSPS